MNTRSCKAKGRRLQNEVRDTLLAKECWKDLASIRDGKLDASDVKPAIMGETGVDIQLSPRGRSYFPFSVECKNTEKSNPWQWIKQSEENTIEDTIPLVVFKRNHSKTYCILEFNKLLELI